MVYHAFWRRLCLRRADLQLLCQIRRLVPAHAGSPPCCTIPCFFAYSLRFARKHEVYDYRSYNDAFYGRFSPIFSNLFEVLYICVMCVAPAVAFATGGATLSTLTGLPYLLCTLLIGVFIFVVAIFGTDLVRAGGVHIVDLHCGGSSDRLHPQYHSRIFGDFSGGLQHDPG